MPTDSQVARCDQFRGEVEAALAETFGAPLTLAMRVETPGAPGPKSDSPKSEPQADSEIDVHDLTDADVGNATVVDRISDVFPGAEVLQQES